MITKEELDEIYSVLKNFLNSESACDMMMTDEIRNCMKIIEREYETKKHDWQWYFNGTFCRKCNAQLGDGKECI